MHSHTQTAARSCYVALPRLTFLLVWQLRSYSNSDIIHQWRIQDRLGVDGSWTMSQQKSIWNVRHEYGLSHIQIDWFQNKGIGLSSPNAFPVIRRCRSCNLVGDMENAVCRPTFSWKVCLMRRIFWDFTSFLDLEYEAVTWSDDNSMQFRCLGCDDKILYCKLLKCNN